MTIERELLKEVLEYFDPLGLNTEHCGDLPERIKELLAQPEQEPVAWMYEWEEIGGKEWTSVKNGKYPPIVEEEYCMRNLRPLYTAPPTREPLSDEEIYKLSLENFKGLLSDRINFVRAVEKAHGIGGGNE